MPFLAMNRGAKQFGIQTYAKAKALMPELRDVELEYLSVRDWYVEQLNAIAQMEEHLAQAKAEDRKEDVASIGNRMQRIQAELIDARSRVKLAGERSWAEAFVLAADNMLPHDVLRALGMEADRLVGRQRHELAPKRGR